VYESFERRLDRSPERPPVTALAIGSASFGLDE